MANVPQQPAALIAAANPRSAGRYALELTAGAAGYFVLALLGLELASAAPQVSVVWPASGAAVALLVLRGARLWPAIALGAFAANLASGASLAAVPGIALGNTLESLVGAALAVRMSLHPGLRRRRDVFALFAVITPLAPIMAATLGVASLCIAGAEPWSEFGPLWSSWWLGDALGILIVAPFAMTWVEQAQRGWHLGRALEALLLVATLLLLSATVFSTDPAAYPIHYLIFPAVIWSALRLGQHATASVAFGAALVATAATLAGRGPFVSATGHISLLHVELFMGVIAVTGLVLGAVMAERNRAEREARRVADAIAENAAQLSREDRRKDEFLAVLAHELRNPLAPLQNAVGLLARASHDAEIVTRVRGVLERQLHHLVRLVDDLLDLSRIRSGKILLALKPLELSRAVEDAVEMAQAMITARRHQLSVRLPQEAITLDADPTRLPQLIANLLNNAAKFTPEEGRIELSAGREGSGVTIRVRDSGIGMTPEALAEVFELFAQAPSPHAVQGGLGLGLSIARALAELHGGTLEARSEGPGHGSEFIVRLPASVFHKPREPAVSSVDGPLPPGQRRPQRRTRVLVCDDNADAADTLVALLEELGFEAQATYDGTTALRIARDFAPEAMVLDLGMPGMDGFALAQAVRNDSALARVRLVALSGYGTAEDRRRTAQAGFDAHLVKPVEVDVVANTLRG